VQLTYGIGGNRTWQRTLTFYPAPNLPDTTETLGTITAAITVVSDSIIALPFPELVTESSGADYYLISADSNILEYGAFEEFDLGYQSLNQIETVFYFPKKDSVDINFTLYSGLTPTVYHYYTP